jgi:hypothetical protein
VGTFTNRRPDSRAASESHRAPVTIAIAIIARGLNESDVRVVSSDRLEDVFEQEGKDGAPRPT